MSEMRRWLIIDPAGDEIRVLKAAPALKRGEAAFPLIVRIPDTPRRVFTESPITLTMPGWQPPIVAVGEGETVEESSLQIDS